jgi:hypothetical protein
MKRWIDVRRKRRLTRTRSRRVVSRFSDGSPQEFPQRCTLRGEVGREC